MSVAEDSIRGQLLAAVKAQAEPEETAAEVVETETPVVETKTETQERARDESGRFVAKEAADAVRSKSGDAANGVAAKGGEDAAVSQRPIQDVAAQDGKRDPQSQPDAAPLLAPPNGWSAEAKAKWHELSPEVMAAVQKREQDIAKFTSTRDEHASFGKEIYQAVQPYLATIKAEGGTPKGAIESLLNTAYVLRVGTPEQKKQLLLQTAAQFGVDLGQPAKAPNGQQPQNIPLGSIQAEIDRALAEREHARQQQTDSQIKAEVSTEIEAFAADPKHPHFELVKGHMSALISSGAAKDLQDAYDQAVWARPDTRATLQAQQRAEEEQKRKSEAKAKAEAAKRKSVSITGGPGNTAANAAPGGRSIREELEAARAAQSGGV